jgi:hypothetical protein
MIQHILANKALFTDSKGEVHTCVDNAVSSLAKCIYQHAASNQIDEQTIRLFLSLIPLTNDEEEACVAHSLFIKQVGTNALF